VLAIRRVVPADQVAIELLAPTHRFTYRPLRVLEPFGREEAWRLDLSSFAADQHVGVRVGALAGVDAAAQAARTTAREELVFTVLSLATGARSRPWLTGANTLASTTFGRSLTAHGAAGSTGSPSFSRRARGRCRFTSSRS
jgi:hypothetical protein